MSNSIYATLARQHGLVREMQVLANNLANASTTGYKSDRALFAEFVIGTGEGNDSLSMGGLAAHAFRSEQGSLKPTGGQLDFAIEGEGYFVIETANGERLTRAGHFQLSANGELVDAAGNSVLGQGGGAIVIPPEAAKISLASDGTLSADGAPLGQIAIVTPDGELRRDTSTLFISEGATVPVAAPSVLQGALEQSNVSSVLEVARMIEVQRAYEAGQALLEREDQRINKLISTVRGN